jgi:protease I
VDARRGRRRPGPHPDLSYPSVRTDIRNAGGKVVDQEVVTDQNITSSRWPNDLSAFCARIVEQFAGRTPTDRPGG